MCFSADAVALGVAGVLRIEREKGFLKDEWSLRSEGADAAKDPRLTSSLKVLAESLFRGQQEVALTPANRSLLMSTKAVHEAALARQYQGRYFETNYGWLGMGIPVALVATIVAIALARGNEISVLLAIAGGALMLVTSIVFAFLLRRPTVEGRKLLDHVEGLRRYMSVAERDELASLTSPRVDAERYQALLPYALALDVESAWTKRFTEAVGEAAAEEAARSTRWVGGSGFAGSNFTDMGSSLSRSFSSQIASSSSPPGSSSGGGGGGSSGGGGGGGGGGGR